MWWDRVRVLGDGDGDGGSNSDISKDGASSWHSRIGSGVQGVWSIATYMGCSWISSSSKSECLVISWVCTTGRDRGLTGQQQHQHQQQQSRQV
jgi:hypothetical protein